MPSLDALTARLKALHARHDDNARCTQCGTTRYIPHVTDTDSLRSNRRVCHHCQAVHVHHRIR